MDQPEIALDDLLPEQRTFIVNMRAAALDLEEELWPSDAEINAALARWSLREMLMFAKAVEQHVAAAILREDESTLQIFAAGGHCDAVVDMLAQLAGERAATARIRRVRRMIEEALAE